MACIAGQHHIEDRRSRYLDMIHLDHTDMVQIAFNDFPIPRIPLDGAPPPSEVVSSVKASPEPDGPPGKRQKLDQAEQPELNDDTEVAPSSQTVEGNATDSLEPPPNTLPPQLLTLISTIQDSLRTNFSKSPPHTCQRLAELILEPRKHYRTLPSYLRALDRVATVASPVSAYPLPPIGAMTSANTNALFNGTSSPARDQNDKDFIGGAELTPIPWLRDSHPSSPTLHPSAASDLRTESTSVIDGPNGAGSVETVTVTMNGVSSTVPAAQAAEEGLPQSVSQGELIRQEQEAGITPVPNARSRNMDRGIGTADEMELEGEEEEPVHARGPNVIGMEDMGPQSPSSGLQQGIEITDRSEEIRAPEEVADGEGQTGGSDAVTADADGRAEGEKGVDAGGAEKGADAADSTST